MFITFHSCFPLTSSKLHKFTHVYVFLHPFFRSLPIVLCNEGAKHIFYDVVFSAVPFEVKQIHVKIAGEFYINHINVLYEHIEAIVHVCR